VAIGLDGRKHRRNLNVLVCGGSGSGKTRFYAKPNIMNANTSFVVLDPKGELLRSSGRLLEENGYTIKVIDMINRLTFGIDRMFNEEPGLPEPKDKY
jgi:type IV secretion system protein VirD4